MEIRKRIKKVFGVGINDVTYNVHKFDYATGKGVRVWTCPYYEKWYGMFRRCYGKSRESYAGCYVDKSWICLSGFIKWVDTQPNRDWENCDLDKDLLVEGNKCYSPTTCIFVPEAVNQFVKIRQNDRGDFMLGVTVKYNPFCYVARCNNPVSKIEKDRYIGVFQSELEAHKAWQSRKHEYACQLADLQSDILLAQALRERYAPDKDWTNR
jgi:hypothetical protein